eukprot:COSAG06_NODE_11253_length_1538_cov_1.417651_1_plen_82_part_00
MGRVVGGSLLTVAHPWDGDVAARVEEVPLALVHYDRPGGGMGGRGGRLRLLRLRLRPPRRADFMMRQLTTFRAAADGCEFW